MSSNIAIFAKKEEKMKKRLVMRNVLYSFLKARNGYERLLRAIGHVNEVSTNAPLKEIISAIRNGYGQPPLTIEEQRQIQEAIETLKENEKMVIQRYYGINRKPETLAAIAKSWDRSTERIRQIRNKALRLLRHPARGSAITKIPITWTGLREEVVLLREEVAELKDARLKLEEAQEKLDKYKKTADEVLEKYKETVQQIGDVLDPLISIACERSEKEDIPRDVLKKSVNELELSVRSSRCLEMAGIETIGELCSRPVADLLRVKNFGRKSLWEIQDALTELGLSLRGFSDY